MLPWPVWCLCDSDAPPAFAGCLVNLSWPVGINKVNARNARIMFR